MICMIDSVEMGGQLYNKLPNREGLKNVVGYYLFHKYRLKIPE